MKYKYIPVLFLILFECFSLSAEEPKLIFRNLGTIINSPEDEFLPVVYQDTLYFRRTTKSEKGKKYEVFRTEIKNWTCENDINVFPLIPIANYQNGTKNKKEPYSTNPSSPTFFNYTDSILRWELPKPAGYGINTEFNDLHPAISITGDTLIFISDRPDGNIGGTDLFITIRKADGTWKSPKNLGKKFNTKLNEVSPFIAPNGDLYYASQGFRKGVSEIYWSGQEKKNPKSLSDVQMLETKINYDIMRARKTESGWDIPDKLPYPINTEWDEIGPTVYRDSMILASNRPSSSVWGTAYTPGFDLYGYCRDTCLPCLNDCKDVVIEGSVDLNKIQSVAGKQSGKFEIKDIYGAILGKGVIGVDNTFSLKVPQKYIYIIRINHPCLPSGFIETAVKHKCNRDAIDTINTGVIELYNNCGGEGKGTPINGVPCRKIVIDGKIISSCKINMTGSISILNEEGNEVSTIEINKDGTFQELLDYGKFYDINYSNECMKSLKMANRIQPDCSYDKVPVYDYQMTIPDTICDFKAEKYLVPFFVTGYYLPITKPNLENLRLNFNNFKSNPCAPYIADPDNDFDESANLIDYDSYSKTVEKALRSAEKFLVRWIEYLDCDNVNQNLVITVTGYADQRDIQQPTEDCEFSKYVEEPITNNVFNFSVPENSKMTNSLLSELRAYYTGMHLYNKLMNNASYQKIENRISWKILGQGVDSKNLNLDAKRRVDIGVEIK